MFGWLIEGVKALGKWIISGLVKVISFLKDVLGWFTGQNLDPNKDTPFVVKADDEMRKMLNQAPKKNVGIFNGVYDKNTDMITYKAIDSEEGIDQKTKEVLGGEKLVVLT